MLQVSKEERAFVVEKPFERKSYVAVHAALQQRFNQALPCKKTIQQNITKYRSHEANLNRDKKIMEDGGRLLVLKRGLN